MQFITGLKIVPLERKHSVSHPVGKAAYAELQAGRGSRSHVPALAPRSEYHGADTMVIGCANTKCNGVGWKNERVARRGDDFHHGWVVRYDVELDGRGQVQQAASRCARIPRPSARPARRDSRGGPATLRLYAQRVALLVREARRAEQGGCGCRGAENCSARNAKQLTGWQRLRLTMQVRRILRLYHHVSEERTFRHTHVSSVARGSSIACSHEEVGVYRLETDMRNSILVHAQRAIYPGSSGGSVRYRELASAGRTDRDG